MIKRILFFEKSASIGGGERVLLDIFSSLEEEVKPFVILGERGPIISRLRDSNIPFEIIPIGKYTFVRKNICDFVKFTYFSSKVPYKFVGYARKIKADCLYVNDVLLIPWVSIVGYFLKIPVILHIHHQLVDRNSRKLVEIIGKMNILKKIICVSEGIRKQFPPLLNKSTVIYNGVDTELFHPSQSIRKMVREKMKIDENTVVIANVGYIMPPKGQDFLLRVFKDLLNQHKIDLMLLFVGNPHPRYKNYFKDLIRFVKENELNGKVKFLGFRSDIDEILKSIDILVVSSIYNEGCPMVILEAMSTGVPVVAPDSGGVPEVVIDGVTGLLYGIGKENELKKNLSKLIDDVNMRKIMGENSRKIVMEKFSKEIFNENIRKIINEVIGK
jgi:glycosyltransferase involved in cell wall biosynthesis